jgi:prepilin-type N-terminal cleavage/methylation domain-containing protein
MRTNQRKTGVQRKGMTLLELAVVATLAGLLLGMVVPRIASFREHMLLDSTAQGLARDIMRTRGEALKRNEAVTIRRLADTAYQVRTEAPRRLPSGLTFTNVTVDSVRFHPFGLVAIGVGEWRIQAVSNQRRVVVRTTGHVRVE